MLQDIVEAVPLEGHCLKLRFEDGVEGVVDVAQCVNLTGVFAPLAAHGVRGGASEPGVGDSLLAVRSGP